MRRNVLISILIGAALLLIAAQLLVPEIVAGQVERRLTENGGEATVRINSFPIVRLLAEDGDRIEVRGSGIEVDLQADNRVFERLEGFDEVDVELDYVTAGPFETELFSLERDAGETDYTLSLRSMVSASDLSDLAADQLPGPLGGIFGAFGSSGLLPSGEIPVELDATVRAAGDGIEIVDGQGTVAGIPATPVVEAIAGAIISQL